MAVTSLNVEDGPFAANGVTTTFPFTFKAITGAEVQVVSSFGGAETVRSSSDYSVTLEDEAGGSVVFETAPSSSLGDIYIRSDPSFAQELDLSNPNSLDPEALETAFDLGAVRDLWLRGEIERAMSEAAALGVELDTLRDLLALGTVVSVADFPTVTAATAATISALQTYIRVAGWATAGDGGDALYKRANAAPAHEGYFQSTDGAYWVLVGSDIRPPQFGALGAANDRVAIQKAFTYLSVLGAGRLTFDRLHPGLRPVTDGTVILTASGDIEVTALHRTFGIALAANAGNYPAVIDVTSGKSRFDGFTINENAQLNTTSNVTAGVAARANMAIRVYAAGALDVDVENMMFLNAGGVNTCVANSSTTKRVRFKNNLLTFYPCASLTPKYDNSGYYSNAEIWEMSGCISINIGAAGAANTAHEPHGSGGRLTGNYAEGYAVFANVVSYSGSTVGNPVLVADNIWCHAYGGVTIWALAGTVLEGLTVTGNQGDYDVAAYAPSLNYSLHIGCIIDPAVTGTLRRAKIHGNTGTWKSVVAGTTPNGQSAGLCLDTYMALDDVDIYNNEITRCPCIGLNLYQHSGTARVRAWANRLVDCGTNVDSVYRYGALVRGIFVGEVSRNEFEDTSTGAGLNGVAALDSEFAAAGSEILEYGNTQRVRNSTSARLASKSTQYATAERFRTMVWGAYPALFLDGGEKLFVLTATDATVAQILNDVIPNSAVSMHTEIELVIKNTSGGALTLTMAADFKLASAFAAPATGHTLHMRFRTMDGGLTWQELFRSDVTH
jgi:hypothetical protein